MTPDQERLLSEIHAATCDGTFGAFGGPSPGINARSEIVGLLNDIKALLSTIPSVDVVGVDAKVDRLIAQLHTP